MPFQLSSRCSQLIVSSLLAGYCLSIADVSAHSVLAQTNRLPNASPERGNSFPPQPVPQIQPQTPEGFPPLDTIPLPQSTPLTPPTSSNRDRIFVRGFEVVGSTVFTAEELDEITADYVNRELTFPELLQVRSAISQAYADRGFVTSAAFLPPQTPEGGTVRIQVIEGSLEAIEIMGTQRLHPNYVYSRLARADRTPLNTDEIIAALQLLQLNPRIQRTSAELSAGSQPGLSVLSVEVVEANTVGVDVQLNSDRSPSIGLFERGFLLEDLNLFCRGDRFTLGYRNTDGSDAIDSSYSMPFNAKEGTASLAFSQTWADVIEEPFDILDISSEAAEWTASVRQPLVLKPSAEFALGISGYIRRSRSLFTEDRIGFPLRGSDEEGRTRLTVLRLEQDGLWRSGRQVVAGRSQISLGLDALGATDNNSDPDGQYALWRGQVQWAYLPAPSTLLLVRGNIQLADRQLPPIEQFQIGGIDSVRGYREALLLADNGATLSTEVRLPLFNDEDGFGRIQLVPFLDLGAGWNNGGLSVGRPNNALASTGLGLLWQRGDRLEARFTWGLPLVDGNSSSNTLQDSGISMGLTYTFF